MRGLLLVVALAATCLMMVEQASAQRCNVQQNQQVSTASAVQAAALAQPLLTQPISQPVFTQVQPRSATATSGRVAQFLAQPDQSQQVCTDCQRQAITAVPRSATASVASAPIVTREVVVPTSTVVQKQRGGGPLRNLLNGPPVSKSISGPRRSIAVVRG